MSAWVSTVVVMQVRLLAALWRQISPADREACVAIASADRDRWLSALFNPTMSNVIQECHTHTGYLNTADRDQWTICSSQSQTSNVIQKCHTHIGYINSADRGRWLSALSNPNMSNVIQRSSYPHRVSWLCRQGQVSYLLLLIPKRRFRNIIPTLGIETQRRLGIVKNGFLHCGDVLGHQQLCIVCSSCSDEAACILKLLGSSGQAFCLFEESGNMCNARVRTCEGNSADNHRYFPQDKAWALLAVGRKQA